MTPDRNQLALDALDRLADNENNDMGASYDYKLFVQHHHNTLRAALTAQTVKDISGMSSTEIIKGASVMALNTIIEKLTGGRDKPYTDKAIELWKGDIGASNCVLVPVKRAATVPKCDAPCRVCGHAEPENEFIPPVPDIAPIKAIARECGYAIAVHGSLKRDCDLVAVPWTDTAVTPQELIVAICKGANAHVCGKIENKPHGRIAASIQIDGWCKYIDLSIAAHRAQQDGK